MKKFKNSLQLLSLFYAFSSIILFIYEMSVPSNPRDTVFLRYSLLKLIELATLLSIVIIFLIFAITYQRSIVIRNVILKWKSQTTINWITYVSISLFIVSIGFLTVSQPQLIIRKLSPVFIWLTISTGVTSGMLLRKRHLNTLITRQNKKWFFYIFFSILTLLFLFFLFFYDNKDMGQSTIIITWHQGLIISWIGLTVEFAYVYIKNTLNRKWIFFIFLLLLILFSGYSWQNTTFRGSYNMVGPFSPNNEWFPHSDSARFDGAAQSVLIGEGINYHKYTDNPLMVNYMVFLHMICGGSFIKISTIQIWLLACTPVLIFILSCKLFGFSAGLQSALFYIFRVKNIIEFSNDHSLASPRIFLSEGLLEPFLILFTLFIIMWIESKEKNTRLLIITSFIFGLCSLIRANVWFIFSSLLIYIFMSSKEPFWKKISKCAISILATIVILIPWMYRSSITINTPFFMLYKFQNSIINERYNLEYKNGTSFSPTTNQEMVINDTQKFTKHIPSIKKIEILEDSFTKVLHDSSTTITKYLEIIFSNIKLTTHSFLNSYLILPFLVLNNSTPVLSPINFLHILIRSSFYSKILIAINLVIVTAIISFGFVSLSKINWKFSVILLGEYFSYICASAAAMTSGSRYSQPVEWIFLIFFSVGLSSIAKNYIFLPESNSKHRDNDIIEESNTNLERNNDHPDSNIYLFFIIILFFLSFLLLVTDNIGNYIFIKYDKNEIFENINRFSNNNLRKEFLDSKDVVFGSGRIIYSFPLEGDKEYSHPFFVQRQYLKPNGVDSLLLFVISSSGEKWIRLDLPKQQWPSTSLVWENATYVGVINENKKFIEVCELIVSGSNIDERYLKSNNNKNCK